MIDIVLGLLVAVILGLAIRYIVKAKKSGVKCIGCSVEGGCGQKKSGGCGCGCSSEAEKV